MCVNYKLCVKLHKGPFAFNMEKFPSLENFYTHAVTGVTDNYQVCWWVKSTKYKAQHISIPFKILHNFVPPSNVNDWVTAEILKLFIEELRAQKMPFRCKSGSSIRGKNKIFVKIFSNKFSTHKILVNNDEFEV